MRSVQSSSNGKIRFGVFDLDLRAGELRKRGAKVKLQQQPLQVLQILLENLGEVVSREQLQSRIWPADTFVDFEHGLNNAIRRLREALGDSAETPHYIETLARRGYRFIGHVEGVPAAVSCTTRSLAVLPLENLSHDPEQEYFAEGLTEALITTLAKINDLRVVSRTSIMAYKGARRSVREIARELGVDTIVEGTVLRAESRVRITAQLIDAPGEMHLWAESYERDLRDVLALQAEMAQAIAREVQVKLTPQEEAHLGQVRTVDPEAYAAYLRGRYHWNRRSGEGCGKAIRCFQQAIDSDPTYALAYAGLADCLSVLGVCSMVGPEDGFGKAKGLALQALERDPNLAEGHASLAFAKMWYDFDFASAEKGFKRSIELNPSYVTARTWCGILLSVVGRNQEAYTEVERSIRLDPCSSPVHFCMGIVHWAGHRYDQAIEQFDKAIELEPTNALAYGLQADTYLRKSLYDSAIKGYQKSIQCSQGASSFIAALGEAYARQGNTEAAETTLEQLRSLAKQRYVTPYIVARLNLALGRKDQALDCLQTAYRGRDSFMVFMKVDPLLDELRAETRFEDLLRRMNFPS
jgi:TolB-like protein/Tfp pilus assembly protein PilF